jgi:hypothetical protein
MPEKLFDSACYDLAETFLSDTDFSTPANITELAALIQETIEDFLKDLEGEFAEDKDE